MRRKPVAEWTMEELKQILERVRMSCREDDYDTLTRERAMTPDQRPKFH